MTKTDLILMYLYNKSSRADADLDNLKYSLRHINVDEIDALDFVIQKTRTDTINEVLSEVFRLIADFK